MRLAWANIPVSRVNLFSGETLSCPGQGMALHQLVWHCGYSRRRAAVGKFSQGQAGLGAEGFLSACRYLFAFSKRLVQGISVAQLLASWSVILLQGRIMPDRLIHSLSSVSLHCLQTWERDGTEQRRADRWQQSGRGCRQSGKLRSVLTFRHQKGKTSRVLGRGKRRSSYQCRTGLW